MQQMKTSWGCIIYQFVFFHRACLYRLFLCDQTVNALLCSGNKSMAVSLIKEWDTCLKQLQSAYKIFRWRRGRQWREEKKIGAAGKLCRKSIEGEEHNDSHSAISSSLCLMWTRECCLNRFLLLSAPLIPLRIFQPSSAPLIFSQHY